MDSDDDMTNENNLSPSRVDEILANEMKSTKNRSFHDGYEEKNRSPTIKGNFDSDFDNKAFEQNFVLATLKGVASALKSSYNMNNGNNQPPLTPSTTTTNNSLSSDINSSASSPVSSSSSTPTTPTVSTFNIRRSPHHIRILESMKFDKTSDIESIKNDLIKICRENRMEILAHYVSQIR